MARPKLLVGLTTAIAVLVAGYIAVRMSVRHVESELMEHKRARETTGVVVSKKKVQFDATQTSYQNDEGRSVPIQRWMIKSGEFRVYYKIDNFDQVPTAKQRGLVRGDLERERKFGPRFTIVDQQTYDQAEVGQSVVVRYRWASDSEIEVIVVEFPQQQTDTKRFKP